MANELSLGLEHCFPSSSGRQRLLTHSLLPCPNGVLAAGLLTHYRPSYPGQ